MKQRLPTWTFAAVVAAALAAAIAVAFLPRPVPAEVRPVRLGTLVVSVRDDGVTRIRERHVVLAPLAGTMSRVAIDVGDEVWAGESLVTSIEPPDPALLDPRSEAEARARVDAAVALEAYAVQVIHRAQVQADYTAADLDRAQELHLAKTITHEQLDAAERAWRTAREELEQAEREQDVAKRLVTLAEAAFVRSSRAGGALPAAERRLDVRAPANGRVLRVLREDAGPVAAGAAVVEVGDPADLEVVIDLVSEDAVRVRPGNPCTLTAWGGGAAVSGRVRRVEPRAFTKVSPLGVEEQRVNVIVDIEASPAELVAVGDDFRVEAAITIDTVTDAVLVPLSALFRRGGQEAAFVVERGTARLVPVTTGRHGDVEAEVLTGLTGGERVVVYPADALVDGATVAIVESEDAASGLRTGSPLTARP